MLVFIIIVVIFMLGVLLSTGSDEVAVKVVAVDRGVPPLKAETVILFRVDHHTRKVLAFQADNVTTSLAENLPFGTFVAAMTAYAQSFVTYQLLERGGSGDTGQTSAFSIGLSTGVVRTSAALDYEKRRRYDLIVKVTDAAGESALAALTVLVADVNGKSRPKMARVAMKDVRSSLHVWSKMLAYFERWFCCCCFNLTDNVPKLNFTSIVGTISEAAYPGSMVLDGAGRPLILTAWDMDDGVNKRLTFSILETEPQTYFEILSTGAVRLRRVVDFELQRSYQFHVQVTDGGRPPLSSVESARVTVEVLNVNDCAPVFAESAYNFTVTTPALSGFRVGVIKVGLAHLFLCWYFSRLIDGLVISRYAISFTPLVISITFSSHFAGC